MNNTLESFPTAVEYINMKVSEVISNGGIFPEGTLDITENGTSDVTNYASVNVQVDPPTGTYDIIRNGIYDVEKYASANVDVHPELGEKTITENGTYIASDDDVEGYSQVTVNTPVPAGTKEITQNGTDIDVFDYAKVDVDVQPNVESKSITQNGTYNASSENLDGYSSVNVNVQPNLGNKSVSANGTYKASSDHLDGYSQVSVNVEPNVGTKTITTNGTYNASSENLDGYSSVTVNTPVPAGTTDITQNGTYNVTDYASAEVNVQPNVAPKTVTHNGTYNASSDRLDGYSQVVVDTPVPAGKKTITSNGTDIDVFDYATADVNVEPNVGSKTITQNGTYNSSSDNLDGYSQVVVDTPVPTGKTIITQNGTDINIADYALADVNVPQGVFPSGTKNITQNGTEDVTNYQNVNVQVPQGVFPTGTKDITENGVEDVTNYENVNVNVQPNVDNKSITENGTYNASSDDLDGYSQVTVDVEPNVDSKSINANGTYNASSDHLDGYSQVVVNVPGLVPTGTTNITQNGTYNVTDYATAEVEVPQPTGKMTITENGTNIDIASYATADVNVPQGVFPEGTLPITQNGEHTVTTYDKVNVSVQPNVDSKSISANGTYNASSENLDGYSSVTVNVPQPTGKTMITQNGTDINIAQYATADVNVEPNVGTKTISQNGTYNASSDELDGYSQVIVDTPVPTGKKTITANGTDIDVASYATADVNVEPNVDSKSISSNGTYNASSDHLDGYSQVTVSVQPNVGSKSISSNGTYNASSDSLDGYSQVTVDVEPNVDSKSITSNGTYNASSDSLDGYSSVTVNVPQGVFPSGTKNISSNGTSDVTNYASVNVQVPQGVFPEGTKEITQNGTGINVTNYEYADVNVQPNVDVKTVTNNGTYVASQEDLDGYSQVNVNVQPNVGQKTISQNGTYNASSDSLDGYSQVIVSTPVPTGKKTITENGTDIDVASYATADVNVQPNVDSKSISANGTYNASSDELDGYSSVTVSVPQGVFPTGTLSITQNGIENVTNYENVNVNVLPDVDSKTITQNGTYTASSENLDGYSSVTVEVPQPSGKTTITENGTNINIADYALADVNVQPNVGTKVISTNGIYNASSDSLDGYSQVTVQTPVPSGTKTITENGTNIDVSSYATADVNVEPDVDSKTITENGTYTASSEDLDGYSSVTVNVQPDLGTKSINANGTYTASSDNLDGYSSVTVNVPGIIPTGNTNITENGTYDVSQYAGAVVNVPQYGKPVVPQTGTWQFKSTYPYGFIIIGKDDDTVDSAKFVRMVNGYGFPVVLNSMHQGQNTVCLADVDTQYSQYPQDSGGPFFPNGCTINELNKFVIRFNLGEVALHGGSDEKIWDSSLLTGTILDNYYETYTTGGGLKTKEELKTAIMEKYESTDVSQGASIVKQKINLLQESIDNWIYTIGRWGGSFDFIIDEINCGSNQAVESGTQKIDRQINMMGDGVLSVANNRSPYYISRDSSGLAGNTESDCNFAYNNRIAVELFQHYYIDDSQGHWNTFKSALDTISSFVDQNKICVVTRKQYYELGEFVSNPIVSLYLATVDQFYQVGTTLTASDFTMTANLYDGTSVTCSDDRILDISNVDTATVGVYTAYLEYRGFKTQCMVTISNDTPTHYLLQNYSASGDSIERLANFGIISPEITYESGKSYRIQFHLRAETVAQYASHYIVFNAPIYNGATTWRSSTDVRITPNNGITESDITIDLTVNSTTNIGYLARLAATQNSSVGSWTVTDGYIYEYIPE